MMLEAMAASAASEAGFFADWLAGLNVGGVILMIVGIALIIIEMIIPGFGIAGVSGGVAVVAGLIVSSKTIGAAMFSLAIIVVILCIAALIVFKVVFGKKRGKSRLVLNERIESGSSELRAEDAAKLVGQTGIALTSLRPSGIAMINGRRLDVLAEGEFIAKGESVEVAEVQGLNISVVKK